MIVLVLLGLIGAGGTLTLVGLRRRRGSEPAAATTSPAPAAVEAGLEVPALWHGRSGGSSNAVTRSTATIAAAPEQGGGGPRSAGDPPGQRAGEGPRAVTEPRRRDGAAAIAADRPTPVTPDAEASTGAPPDRGVPWTAEIEWREMRRRVALPRRRQRRRHGRGGAVGPAGVAARAGPRRCRRSSAQRMSSPTRSRRRDGRPCRPASAWYAKRFAWEPGRSPPKARAQARPTGRPARSRPRPPARRCPPPAPRGSRRSRSRPPHALALEAARAVLVLRPSSRSSPPCSSAAGATTRPRTGRRRARPLSQGEEDGSDLAVPLLVLLGVTLVVADRQAEPACARAAERR